MQKLLSLKLASNIPRKLSNNSSSYLHSHPYKTFASLTQSTPSQYLISHTGQQAPQFFFSHFNYPYSWLLRNGVSEKIYGVLSNSVLAKQFFSSTHLRNSSQRLINSRVWFLRPQFSRKNFVFNSSHGSYRRQWRSWFSRLSDSDVVYGLIIVNAAVFMLWRYADRKFMMENFMVSLDNFKAGRVHTLITSAFSHIRFEHIISNMIGLYFFGTSIARAFGPEFLLKLYLAGALGGSVFYLVHHAFMASSSQGQGSWTMDPSRTPGLGASGAVNAIMLLNIFLFPKSTIYLEFFIPVPAILLGVFLVGKDTMRIIQGDSQISGSAHLGGAAVAAIAWALIKKGRL